MWALTWGIFLFYAIRRRWTRLGLLIGIANMVLVSLNVVAPFRGLLDPRYVGYNFFLISIPPGFGVTLVAGSMLLLSARFTGPDGIVSSTWRQILSDWRISSMRT